MPTESEIPPVPGTQPVPQRSLASLRSPRGELAKTIPRRPRVSLGLGLAMAFVFALLVMPTLTLDRLLAKAGMAEVELGKPAPITVRVPSLAGFETVEKRFGSGGIVIARGQVASQADVENVQAVVAAAPTGALPYVALFLLPLVLAAIFTHHMRRSTRGRLVRVQLVSLATIVAVAIAIKIAMLFTAVSALVVPVALIAFVATMALDRIVGLASGVLLALVVGLLGPFDVGVAVVLLVQAAVAGLVVAEQPKDRVRAVLVAGGITTLCTVGTFVLLSYLTTGALPTLSDPLHSPWFAALLGPVLASVLAVPLVPVYQLLVGEITRAKLVELEDHSNPLLKQIATRAPGTWQHSLMMANMAEIAASAIGANARLVRVGALFHDLGKSLQPKYFIENLEPGETSPHDKLPPEVSTDAIFAHVTEGIVTARKAGLHERIVDFMHMHHGNGVLEYFWGKAQEQGNPNGFTIEDFRYPGHPPQSRETAILAICDAVEAASRTLKKPDAKAIDALVQRIVYGKLHLGQLDESGLSMSDLRILSNSLKDTIRHANHGRIEYPWQKAQQDASASEQAPTGTQPRLDSLDRAPDSSVSAARPKPQVEVVDSREITAPRAPDDSDALVATAPIPASERAKSVSAPPAKAAPSSSEVLSNAPPAKAQSTMIGHQGAPLERDSEPEVEISSEPSKPIAVARDTSQPNVIAREPSGPIAAARTRSGEQAAVRRTGEQPALRRTGEQPAVRRTGEQPIIDPISARTRSSEIDPATGRTRSSEQPAVRRTGEQPIIDPMAARTRSSEIDPGTGRTRSSEIDPITGRTRSSDFAPVPSGLARPGRAASQGPASESGRHATASSSGDASPPAPASEARKPPSAPPATRPAQDNVYPPAELRAFAPDDPRYARGPSTMERRAASADVDANEWSDRAAQTPSKPSDRVDPAALQTQKGHAPAAQSWTEKGAQDAPWPEIAGEPSESTEAPGMTTLRGQGKVRTPVVAKHDTIPPPIVEPRRRAATLPPMPPRRAPTVPPTPIPRKSSPTIPPTTPLDARKSGPPFPVDLENATTNPPPMRFNTTLVPAAAPRPPARPADMFHEQAPAHVHTDATATGIPKASESDLEERVTLPPIDENLRTTIPPDLAGRTTPSMPAMDEAFAEASLSVGDDTSPSLDIQSIDTLDIHPGEPRRFVEREEAATNPAMPRFVDAADRGHAPREMPLRAPPTNPPATRPSKPPPASRPSLAARVDAAMAADEWSPETPVKAPTSAELRSLLGKPDPTRQQSIEEIERLHQASRDVETPDPEILNRPRRAHHPTNEVGDDDIEAAIEIVPPARRPASIGVAKPKKPHE